MQVRRLLLLTLPLAAIAVFFAYHASSAEYVLNTSFERDGRPWLSNWEAENGELRSVNGGIVGRFAARVVGLPDSRVFTLVPTGSPVASTVAGQRYDASAFVRSGRPGTRVVLGIREWNGNRLVDFARVAMVLTRKWQAFPRLSYRAKAQGHQLDLYVRVPAARKGDRFDVDDLSLAEPLTAEVLDNAHIGLVWSATRNAARYSVYRGELLVGTTAERTFTDTLLWPGTIYAYRVDALDGDGDVLTSRAATQTTGPLPSSGFQRPFPPTSFWNRPIPGDVQIDSRSGAKIAYLLRTMRNPNLTLHEFAVPVAEAHPGDQRFSVPCTRYRPCTLGAFGRLPIPVTAQPDAADDGHLAVYDSSSRREWGMWQANHGENSWSASAGAAVSTRGNGVAPPNTAGANAANFPLLGGIVRPEEILQGRIDHALVFTTPRTGRGRPTCPATHNGGSVNDADALRQGAHLQLDPSLDLSTLAVPVWEGPILRALQVYGMYLRDQGGSLAIYGENPISRGYDAWALASPDLATTSGSKPLLGVPWERFRVLAAPDGPNCR
jgi:hypothetical protein